MAFEVSDGEHLLKVEASRLEVRPHDELFEVEVDGEKKVVSISWISPAHLSILLEGKSYNVEVERFGKKYQVTTRGETYEFSVTDEREVVTTEKLQASGTLVVTAPMPGLVVEIMCSDGEQVEAGQGILVLEAMKMQNEITAPASGIITGIPVESGASVNLGDNLFIIES
ncbi:MAG: acetyl-CoA carboxylase biotin carboxyl carrier protein subunit [Candidatus Aegiribacteria sp.]|nr:acetyl-CoA carboxylase biotin carboxyl carrier protein subunit [Candidatus Aegiribacteria sp.]